MVLKDINWRKMGMKLNVSPEDRERLLSALNRDSQFLAKINILDYSLLVGIIDNDESTEDAGINEEGSKISHTMAEPVHLAESESQENIPNAII